MLDRDFGARDFASKLANRTEATAPPPTERGKQLDEAVRALRIQKFDTPEEMETFSCDWRQQRVPC